MPICIKAVPYQGTLNVLLSVFITLDKVLSFEKTKLFLLFPHLIVPLR